MIDIHCHLLPSLDDGAQTMAQSLALARFALADGIKKIVVTPHIHPGRYDNQRENIRVAWLAFKQALAAENLPLLVGMAAEVRIDIRILSMIEQDQIPFLGRLDDYQILLLELPHGHIPPGSDRLVRWLLDRKIRPMIAHPERNGDVLRDLRKIYPFVEAGCMLQLTAASLAGDFKALICQRARELLEQGWVDVIASDSHNLEYRPPNLANGWKAATQIVGPELAWKMVSTTPAAITQEQWNL